MYTSKESQVQDLRALASLIEDLDPLRKLQLKIVASRRERVQSVPAEQIYLRQISDA